jgi:hypothetical protein
VEVEDYVSSLLLSPLHPPFSSPEMASSGTAPSVSLNRNRQGVENTQPPVWAIDNAVGSQNPPLQAKCARHVDERHGVCCKELKPDDERQLVDPDIIRDAVIGLSVRRKDLSSLVGS